MPIKKKKKEVKPIITAAETPSEDASLAVIDMQIVKPMVTPKQAIEAWRAYQELKKALLDPSDYQDLKIFMVGRGMVSKPFVKKSGWRKLATAFNISVEIVKEERKEYNLLKPTFYFVVEMTAKATAMNGRNKVGTGSCASNERGFAHLEHDVRSTAETRAKSRAIADLIGGGETSAEEMLEQKEVIQNNCSQNHADLQEKTVQSKDSKNFNRPYVLCEVCKYFAWMDHKEAIDRKTEGADQMTIE